MSETETKKENYEEVSFDTLQDGDKFNRKIRRTQNDMDYFERQVAGSEIVFADGVSTVGETVDMWKGDKVFVKVGAPNDP